MKKMYDMKLNRYLLLVIVPSDIRIDFDIIHKTIKLLKQCR